MISPDVGDSIMLRVRKKVLLPVPDGPMILMTSPRRISQLMSFNTCSFVPSGLVNVLAKCFMVIIVTSC